MEQVVSERDFRDIRQQWACEAVRVCFRMMLDMAVGEWGRGRPTRLGGAVCCMSRAPPSCERVGQPRGPGGTVCDSTGTGGCSCACSRRAGSGTTGCKKSIVLLTDNSNSASELSGVLAAIETRDDINNKAAIFTYSIGESADRDGGLGKSIACARGGIWAAIAGEDFSNDMSAFCTFQIFVTRSFCHNLLFLERVLQMVAVGRRILRR